MVLESQDVYFLESVQKIAFMNPHSKERRDLERTILGTSILGDLTVYLEKYRRALGQVLSKYDPRKFHELSDTDARLVLNSKLFELYLAYNKHFDELIDAQKRAGRTKNISFDFGAEFIASAVRAGFDEKRAEFVFAVFFQFRRADLFIRKYLQGNCPSMTKLREQVWNTIFTRDGLRYLLRFVGRLEDYSTLLLGQTGSGKGTVAKIIGLSSFIPYDAQKKQFKVNFCETYFALNLSQYPESLIESELFGHAKGAFTGALRDRIGFFQKPTKHCILFLDEIGDITPHVQVKLLNVIQDRLFTPLGSDELFAFDGRLVTATNKNIDELRERGVFRDDLYYRISSNVIEVPTLFQRIQENKDELPLLVNSILSRNPSLKIDQYSDEIIRSIEQQLPPDYPWPGNVRELEQCIRRITLTGEYRGERTSTTSKPMAKHDLFKSLKSYNLTAKEVLSGYCEVEFADCQSYSQVSKKLKLDRRTVQKYLS